MPTGAMVWFDERSGEGRISASGRQYPAWNADVEPRARRAGARVHFDVARVDGVPVAVRVTAVEGTRTSTRQARAGDLTGAARPDAKGGPATTRSGGRVEPSLAGRPMALVRRWIAAADSGHLDTVLPLYAPHAVVHAAGVDHHGRGAVRAYLTASGLLSRGWHATPAATPDGVVAVRGAAAPDAGASTRFRIAHGQIVEQWVEAGRPA